MMRPLRSLRVRLIAVFATVVLSAMGVLFLYVVPSLRENLISNRQARLESVAREQQRNDRLQAQFRSRHIRRGSLVRVAGVANAQVAIYLVTPPHRLVASPLLDPPSVGPRYPVVLAALRASGPVAGRAPSGSVIVAYRMPGAVVLMTQRIGDVNDAATLVERQFLIATLLALGVAGLVGWRRPPSGSPRAASTSRSATRRRTSSAGWPARST